MVNKYSMIQREIFRYIQNRLAVHITVDQIANEVEEKFPTWIIFSQSTPEMKREIIEVLVNQSRWLGGLYGGKHSEASSDDKD